jgi:hypothetical protein
MTPDPYGRSRGAGPELRIGDDEREAAVRALGEHFAAGRLTKEEFDERSDRAWVARTRSALMPLFADLPRAEPGGPQAIGSFDRRDQRGQRGPRPAPGHPGWWFGARLAPVLAIVIALVVLTHLPLFLLLLIGWVLLVKSGRHWGHRSWERGHTHPWVR